MERSKRAGARRKTLAELREIKSRIIALIGWWDVRGDVFIEPEDRKPGENVYLRERLAEEYPEMQQLYWTATIDGIDAMLYRLNDLREHCLSELYATEGK